MSLYGAGPLRADYWRQCGYKPRSPSQAAYHEAARTHRYISLFTFPRLGKSRCAAAEVGATYLNHDYHCWIVAPKYSLGAKEFGYIWDDHSKVKFNGRPLIEVAQRKVFNIQGGDMELRYPWGWYVQVKTADNPADLLGEELDDLILAEGAQIAESVWDRFLYARITKRRGRTHVPTTPKGQNWLHERFYLPGRKLLEGAPNAMYNRHYWSATVSATWGQGVEGLTLPKCGDLFQPGIYDEETMAGALKQGMPHEVYLEQFGGQFVSYAGLVYKGVNKARHGCPPREIPAEWDLVIGIDPGAGADPTAIIFGAWDRQAPQHFWVWGLVYEHGRPIQFYADAIHRRLAGRRPYAVVVDTSEKQFRIELGTGHGLGNVAPHSRQLQDRYVAVSSLIGTGRLHVFDTEELTPVWDEFSRYGWKEGMKGEIAYDKTSGPDHAMDALGYAVLVPGPWHEDVVKDPLGTAERAKAGLPALLPMEQAVWASWERQVAARRLLTAEDAELTDVEVSVFAEEEEAAEVWG